MDNKTSLAHSSIRIYFSLAQLLCEFSADAFHQLSRALEVLTDAAARVIFQLLHKFSYKLSLLHIHSLHHHIMVV